jgi:hypothetical protein
MVTDSQRQKMGMIMDLLINHEPAIHYKEIRPMQTTNIMSIVQLKVKLEQDGGITMDCSESVTLISKLAGLQDPNGNHYDGYGFTGTLLENLPHYEDPRIAKIGAMVVFGPGTGEHVCMVRHRGMNPILFSHGQERDPIYISLSEERKFHKPPVTFLSIADL